MVEKLIERDVFGLLISSSLRRSGLRIALLPKEFLELLRDVEVESKEDGTRYSRGWVEVEAVVLDSSIIKVIVWPEGWLLGDCDETRS